MPDIQTKRTLANPLTLWGGLVCYPRIIEWLIAENLLFFSVFALDKRHNIIEWDWNYLFNPLYLIIDDYFIYGSHNEQYGDLNILGKGISSSEDEFIFSVFKEYDSRRLQIEWKKLVGNDYNLILKLDGDYLHVYKNIVSEKNLLYTLVRTNKDTLAQIKKFVKKSTFDLSEVTWPRHADGSCDYDGSTKTAAVQTAKATSSTNVAPNTTMTVRENLKLRSGEAASTQVLAVMSAGAKDRDGKPIKKARSAGASGAIWSDSGTAEHATRTE